MADTHHLVKVGDAVALPALLVVHLLALARAVRRRIDFA